MKLVFIENRHKTYFFEAIAKQLETTHEVHWIVQNPMFNPSTGDLHKITFPKHKRYEEKEAPKIDYQSIITSDRQLNFFGKDDHSYLYYYASKIDTILQTLQPDLVFGESTAFHELLTIALSKKRDILYLNPSTCRYPAGRFSFYKYDTLEPYKGSGEQILTDKGKAIINAIVNRTVKPDYMKRVSLGMRKKLKDKVKMTLSYYRGESYNTPSPIVKLRQEREKKALIRAWDALSKNAIDRSAFAVVYPLQMQPEANIDVWGRKHRDQLDTVKLIHSQLQNGDKLYIKPNPKSKYEISEALLAFIEETPNVVALHHAVSMNSIFNKVDVFVTVTGTIAIECILSNRPVISLINTIHNTVDNCVFAENEATLKAAMQSAKDQNFPRLKEAEQIEFLNRLNKTSYRGLVSDPFSDANSTSKENIKDLVTAFNRILIG